MEENKRLRILKECFEDTQKAVSNYHKKLVLKKTEHFDFKDCSLCYQCPTCDISLPFLEWDFCPYCGQRLDWSEFIG